MKHFNGAYDDVVHIEPIWYAVSPEGGIVDLRAVQFDENPQEFCGCGCDLFPESSGREKIVIDETTPYYADVRIVEEGGGDPVLYTEFHNGSGERNHEAPKAICSFSCKMSNWRHYSRLHGFLLEDFPIKLYYKKMLYDGAAIFYRAYKIVMDMEASTLDLAFDPEARTMGRSNNSGSMFRPMPELPIPEFSRNEWNRVFITPTEGKPELADIKIQLGYLKDTLIVPKVKVEHWRKYLFDIGFIVSRRQVRKFSRQTENTPHNICLEYFVYPSIEPWGDLASSLRHEGL